jgi:uncharacterized cupin superfamily protein
VVELVPALAPRHDQPGVDQHVSGRRLRTISFDIILPMNLAQPTWDAELPSQHGTLRAVRLAHHAGAQRLAANLYELEQGAAVSPLHFHHANEELLFVLSGTPTLRRGPDDERTLSSGDVVAFLPGPSGTHQILNRAAEPTRVLIIATNDLPEVAEQTEDQRMAVITSHGLRLLPLSAPIADDRGPQPR